MRAYAHRLPGERLVRGGGAALAPGWKAACSVDVYPSVAMGMPPDSVPAAAAIGTDRI